MKSSLKYITNLMYSYILLTKCETSISQKQNEDLCTEWIKEKLQSKNSKLFYVQAMIWIFFKKNTDPYLYSIT